MSRIGKKSIDIPKNVTVVLNDQNKMQKTIVVKGQYGLLEREFYSDLIHFEQQEKSIQLTRISETKKAREYHGLIRVLIQNMILGVDQYFSKTLIAEGVGYKFQLENNILSVNVGFTHVIKFIIPKGLMIKFTPTVSTKITIFGIDKEKVGFFTSKIRALRPPEPYKGKGLLYENEKIRRKVGKTGK